MPARFWFAEDRHGAKPRQRNFPTTVYREQICSECGNHTSRQVIVKGDEGSMPFWYGGQEYSWLPERQAYGGGHKFPRYEDAAAALEAHKTNARNYATLSGTGNPSDTKRLNKALRHAWGLDN